MCCVVSHPLCTQKLENRKEYKENLEKEEIEEGENEGEKEGRIRE